MKTQKTQKKTVKPNKTQYIFQQETQQSMGLRKEIRSSKKNKNHKKNGHKSTTDSTNRNKMAIQSIHIGIFCSEQESTGTNQDDHVTEKATDQCETVLKLMEVLRSLMIVIFVLRTAVFYCFFFAFNDKLPDTTPPSFVIIYY